VENVENVYLVLDPNRPMININNEPSNTHKKLSNKKLWARSQRNSWRTYKTHLTIKYRMHSRNTKIQEIKT
jgi:hypothetical protein